MGKIERTLNAWHHLVVKVKTDENLEDMEWAVVLEDHGDEYLIVKTKDEKIYKYGCFANLRDSKWIMDDLMRKPEMYKELDGTTSNDIYFLIDRELYDFSSFSAKRYYSKEDAQWHFDYVMNRLIEIHESSKYTYDSNSHKHEAGLFLKKNGINTEENLQKLNETPWDSRIDGVDGIAGKEDISGWDHIYFESIRDVYIIDESDLEIVEDDETDEYGYGGYYLNIKPDKKLHANMALYEAVVSDNEDEDEDDWDDGNDRWNAWQDINECNLSESIKALFYHTFIDEETGEALYLIVDKSGRKPTAGYFDMAAVLKMLGKE